MTQEPSNPAPSPEGADVTVLTVSRRVAETAILLILLVAGVLFFIGSRAIRSRSDDLVAAHTFPEALSVLLIVTVCVAIVLALRIPADIQITLKRPRGVAVAIVLLLLFPPLVQVLGYYVLIVPWLVVFGWAARVRSPFLIAINLITVLFVARVVFQMILRTPMP